MKNKLGSEEGVVTVVSQGAWRAVLKAIGCVRDAEQDRGSRPPLAKG